ncbi:MAG: hypothetical protein Ct9H90mP18_08580 [Gammaproteobacteria bacterium]|nr:MAG: hypothetical protein Ct9H90mP18_08580 [Gammaproteobacteria bacterium]
MLEELNYITSEIDLVNRKNQRKIELKKLFLLKPIIGIGSNQHNPKYHVIRGIREINHLPKIDIQKKSSLYETPPLGPQNQPNFINAVIKITTSYQPFELLAILQ